MLYDVVYYYGASGLQVVLEPCHAIVESVKIQLGLFLNILFDIAALAAGPFRFIGASRPLTSLTRRIILRYILAFGIAGGS